MAKQRQPVTHACIAAAAAVDPAQPDPVTLRCCCSSSPMDPGVFAGQGESRALAEVSIAATVWAAPAIALGRWWCV